MAFRRASGFAAPESQPARAAATSVETSRPDGARQSFAMVERGGYLEIREEIPEPHDFAATLRVGAAAEAHRSPSPSMNTPPARAHRDNNMRAAVIHVMADAAVSVLVIVGLLLARAVRLAVDGPARRPRRRGRDRELVLRPDPRHRRDAARHEPRSPAHGALRRAIERDGDRVADLHLWRLGPGHLGAILSIETESEREADHYREAAMAVGRFSHLTIEIARRPRPADRQSRRFVA